MSDHNSQSESNFERELGGIPLPAPRVNRDELMYQSGYAAGQSALTDNRPRCQSAAVNVGSSGQTKSDIRIWKRTAGGLAGLSTCLAAVLTVVLLWPNGQVGTMDKMVDRKETLTSPIEPNSPNETKNESEKVIPRETYVDPVLLVQRPIQNFSSGLLTVRKNYPVSTRVQFRSADEDESSREPLSSLLAVPRQIERIKF